MIVPPSFSTKSADMQPQPVWKNRWSVGANTPQIDDVRLAVLGHERLVRVDRVEALGSPRGAPRDGSRRRSRSRGRACRGATFIVQSSPHIVATSSMSERIGPA